MVREAGIILPVYSLPGKYGIGTMGKEAYQFVDFLVETGQTYWQILPLGHTNNGSPYEVISSFAGNMYLIDGEKLVEEGILEKEELEGLSTCGSPEKIHYKDLYQEKEKVLRKAYQNRLQVHKKEMECYRRENSWLEDYALYNALNRYFKTESWLEWERSLKNRETGTLEKYRCLLKEEMDFWYFVQYFFMKQWKALKQYANERGIQLIGDIPFYISMYSVDVWVNPELFWMDQNRNATRVAGCPKDCFNEEGQYWGYPVYNWAAHKKQDYAWWHARIIYSKKMFDLIRLDHFIGFTRAWHIPADTKIVSQGQWVAGPGEEFFDSLYQKEPALNLIAEDLGAVGQDVITLRDHAKCLGMKVLLLGFDSREKMDYRPHTYEQNVIAYTTVHDTDPVNGWFETADTSDIQEAVQYLNLTQEEGYHWGMIRGIYSSVARIAMIQLQDLLGYGSWARMNLPPLLLENWTWRLGSMELLEPVKQRLHQITRRYDRERR